MGEVDKLVALLQGNISLNILLSVLIILILWLLSKIVHGIIEKRVTNIKSNYKWKKTTSYIAVFLGFILVGRIWFEGIQSLATFLGLLSAGLAIALKDVISNFAGWLFIMWRKPFVVGNRIQIGNHSGDVIDIRPFQFTILEIGNWVKAD